MNRGLPMPLKKGGSAMLPLAEWREYRHRQAQQPLAYELKWRRPGVQTAEAVWELLAPHGLDIAPLLPSIYKRLPDDEQRAVVRTAKQALTVAIDCFIVAGHERRVLILNRIFDALCLGWSDHFRAVVEAGLADRARDMREETVKAARRDLLRNGIDLRRIWKVVAREWSGKQGRNPLYWTAQRTLTISRQRIGGRRVFLKHGATLAEFERIVQADPGHERTRFGWRLLPAETPTRQLVPRQESCAERPYNVVVDGPRAKRALDVQEQARLVFNVGAFKADYRRAVDTASTMHDFLQQAFALDASLLSDTELKLADGTVLPSAREWELRRFPKSQRDAICRCLSVYDRAAQHLTLFDAADEQLAEVPDDTRLLVKSQFTRIISRRYQAEHLWPMTVSGKIDQSERIVAGHATLTLDTAIRGRWFTFPSPLAEDVHSEWEGTHTLVGADISSSQSQILAALLNLRDLEDLASSQSFTEYLVEQAWSQQHLLEPPGYDGLRDPRLKELVKETWMRTLYGSPLWQITTDQRRAPNDVGPGWRKQRGKWTSAPDEFLKWVPQYAHVAKFLAACRAVGNAVDSYQGFTFTDPFDGTLVRWHPVKRDAVILKSNGLQILVSLPGQWRRTHGGRTFAHAVQKPPNTGDYPINRRELTKKIAPMIIHTLDAAFAGLVIEELQRRGVRDFVSIHDGWIAPVDLHPIIADATRAWFLLLGRVYADLLRYPEFGPLLRPASDAWRTRVETGDWPQPFYAKMDVPVAFK